MRSVGMADDVILHEEKGEALLLHIASGRYFGLNHSGVVVWNAVRDGADPVERLRAEWPSRERDALERDAEALISQLMDAGLVVSQ